MSKTVLVELQHNRKRLEYYHQLVKAKTGAAKQPVALGKWIEIYSERVSKLERQVTKLGLKTELGKIADSAASRLA